MQKVHQFGYFTHKLPSGIFTQAKVTKIWVVPTQQVNFNLPPRLMLAFHKVALATHADLQHKKLHIKKKYQNYFLLLLAATAFNRLSGSNVNHDANSITARCPLLRVFKGGHVTQDCCS